jgi:putative ATPase
MPDLFNDAAERYRARNAPLADRMRPRSLHTFIGQGHVLGEGKLLRRAIEADQLSSLIFYGPPGTGKTTLARIIANTTSAHFTALNAVLAGVKDIREAIHDAQERLRLQQKRTILFVDEVHRFNKAQQDALLPHVENGTVIFVGATTENPYFEVNKALVSRSRIFELTTLLPDDLRRVARMAIQDRERGYGTRQVVIDDDALEHLVSTANGDARSLLNALELAVETTRADEQGIVRIDLPVAEQSIQKRAVLYDKEGDAHYDTISAFIKSLRGSDPDAALYWMARMVYAGEDPRFIFRRMLIFASEDVGLADPRALQVAVAASQAFDYVGMPEGRFHLAQCCLYLATASKSNTTLSFFDALQFVEQEQSHDVPNPLKDANRDKKGFGHGEGYQYPHAFRDHYVPQQYLPDAMQGTFFYNPEPVGYERQLVERMQAHRERDQEENLIRRVRKYVAKDAPGPPQSPASP